MRSNSIARLLEQLQDGFRRRRHDGKKYSDGIALIHFSERSRAYAFTEQGVAMLPGLSGVARAGRLNVETLRAFVRLSRMLESHDLIKKPSRSRRRTNRTRCTHCTYRTYRTYRTRCTPCTPCTPCT